MRDPATPATSLPSHCALGGLDPQQSQVLVEEIGVRKVMVETSEDSMEMGAFPPPQLLEEAVHPRTPQTLALLPRS